MHSTTSHPLIQEQFSILRQQYAERLPARLKEIEVIWAELHQGPWDATGCATLHRLVHGLSGSGATFGFAALSNTARTLEIFLASVAHTATPPVAEQKAQMATLVATLSQVVHQVEQQTTDVRTLSPVAAAKPNKENRLIFLLDSDPDLARDLSMQIGYFGYVVRRFSDPYELQAVVPARLPAALIVDMSLFDGQGQIGLAALQQLQDMSVPLVFTSTQSDLPARLQAVRAGGAAYFTKPLSIGSLIDTLDTLTVQHTPEPYRILIIDDEPTLAAFYATTLEQDGMITAVVTDPLEVLQHLTEFRPDLILTDMYMPGCTGQELAAVIRQQTAYVSIPIVFLSAEANPDRQLAAMHFGGDDFLTKPIQPDHLVSAVTSRVQRARTLRSFMIRDSLTGLLNHTRTREQLDIETTRAGRYQQPLALAMLDIDHFKAVNDTYGHPVGDRVIKSLARLLKQRLRKTDVVGRYGGEEFAVILPSSTSRDAVHIMDEIRTSFAHIRHQVNGNDLYVTFSCGIAEFPSYTGASQLTQAADQALYEAKRSGRNQVRPAHAPVWAT